MNKKEKKPRLFRWALWWGLGIVVVCLAIMIAEALSTMGESTGSTDITGPMYDVIYRLIYQFGIWPIIIYIGVIGPVFEELCFRLWGDGKQWTGYTSVVLMSLWGLLIAPWVGLLSLAAGIVIMAGLRNDRTKRLFALMMLSTLIFALAHISNYDASEGVISFVVAILHKVGMGLVASYLVINHNILWSMGFHILNNSIMAALMGIAFEYTDGSVTSIETDDFRLDMRCVLVEDDMVEDNNRFYKGSDTNYIFGSMSHFANQAMIYCMEDGQWLGKVKSTPVDAWPKFAFDLVFKREPFAYDALIKELEDREWIQIDTALEDAYRMYIADTALLATNDTTGLSYRDVQYLLYDDFNIMSKDCNDCDVFHISGIDYSNVNTLTIEDVKAILERQGIAIEPATHYIIYGTYNPLDEL